MRGSRLTAWVLVLAAGVMLAACSRQEAAWRSASEQDDSAAYRAYLENYPAGGHAAQAQQRLRELGEQQDWQRALRLDTPESFQRYLAAHPDGRYAAAAHERLATFMRARTATAAEPESAEPPGVPRQDPEPAALAAEALVAEAGDGSHRVQLGAFGDGEQAARGAWQSLRDRYPDLLGSLTARIDVVSRDGRRLWRLRAGPLGEARAREICAALAARATECIVVPG